MNAKRKCQMRHARNRALERYGIDLSGQDYEEIIKLIQDDKRPAKVLFKESNRLTHFEVRWRGHKLKVVYDKQRKSIATFLPPHAYENYGVGDA